MDYVFIGAAGKCSPVPGKKVYNETLNKVEFITGPAFKRGIVYDIIDEKILAIINAIPDFVTLDELAKIADGLDLEADDYEVWEDLAKAVIWMKIEKPHLKGAITRGANHDLGRLQPVPLHKKKGVDPKQDKNVEDVAEVPDIPEDEQDEIDPDALKDEDATVAEPVADAFVIPEGATKYYCTDCKSNHKVSSQAGQNHLEHAGPAPV